MSITRLTDQEIANIKAAHTAILSNNGGAGYTVYLQGKVKGIYLEKGDGTTRYYHSSSVLKKTLLRHNTELSIAFKSDFTEV